MPDKPSPPAKVSSAICRNAGLSAVISGLIVLVTVAVLAIFRYSVASDAANVIAAVGTVLGALVGAFFGIHVGASVGTQAQQTAGKQALRAAVAITPGSDAAKDFLDGL